MLRQVNTDDYVEVVEQGEGSVARVGRAHGHLDVMALQLAHHVVQVRQGRHHCNTQFCDVRKEFGRHNGMANADTLTQRFGRARVRGGGGAGSGPGVRGVPLQQ